jgi:hypothetical protein
MRKFIQKHLDDEYYIKTSEAGNDGIYLLIDKPHRYQYPIGKKIILDKIVTMFSIELEEAKDEVHIWAVKKKPDVDLDFFWNVLAYDKIRFPVVRTEFVELIPEDLIPLRPMEIAISKIDSLYLDYLHNVYDTKPWHKKLWEKITGFFLKKPKPKIIDETIFEKVFTSTE